MALTIDADAHVIEGIGLASEALSRWPDKVKLARTSDGTPVFTIEGRVYPESHGPGAGCPPQHGLSEDADDPHSPAGIVADADREGIDQMVLFPSLGLGVPGIEDPAFAVGLRAALQPLHRATSARPAAAASSASPWCRCRTSTRRSQVLHEAKDARPRVRRDPARAARQEPRPPRPRSPSTPPRSISTSRSASTARPGVHLPQDRRRPLHQLHPGALHLVPVRPDDGDDGADLGRRLRPPPEAARRVPRGRRHLGAVLPRPPARALGEARRLDRERLAARSARLRREPATSGSRASRARRCCPPWSTRSAPTSSSTPATTRTGTASSRTARRRCASAADLGADATRAKILGDEREATLRARRSGAQRTRANAMPLRRGARSDRSRSPARSPLRPCGAAGARARARATSRRTRSRAQLAQDPAWRALLHYRPDRFGGGVDQPRRPAGLLPRAGRQDESRSASSTPRSPRSRAAGRDRARRQHPQCAFAARFAWLDERTRLRARAASRAQPCRALDDLARVRSVRCAASR